MREKKRDGAVRDTTFVAEGLLIFTGSEGSQAMPVSPSDKRRL
jgi:hypothetical protein